MKLFSPLCAALLLSATMSVAQKPAAPATPLPVPAQLTTADQLQIDSAWKDLRIAQLSLQLVVNQIEHKYGYIYDYNQQKFFRIPDAQKPEPAKAPVPKTGSFPK